MTERDELIARLELRAERERRAREEAEHISERVTRELWEQHQELDAKVARRTAEVAAARKAAQDAALARSELLAGAAHELRTPLHASLAALELLEQMRVPPEAADLVEQALRGVLELRDRVNELLEQSEHAGDGFTPSELLDRHEADWLRQAARAGRLLVTDLSPDLPARVSGSVAEHHVRMSTLIANALAGATGTGSVTLVLRPDGKGGLVAELAGG